MQKLPLGGGTIVLGAALRTASSAVSNNRVVALELDYGARAQTRELHGRLCGRKVKVENGGERR